MVSPALEYGDWLQSRGVDISELVPAALRRREQYDEEYRGYRDEIERARTMPVVNGVQYYAPPDQSTDGSWDAFYARTPGGAITLADGRAAYRYDLAVEVAKQTNVNDAVGNFLNGPGAVLLPAAIVGGAIFAHVAATGAGASAAALEGGAAAGAPADGVFLDPWDLLPDPTVMYQPLDAPLWSPLDATREVFRDPWDLLPDPTVMYQPLDAPLWSPLSAPSLPNVPASFGLSDAAALLKSGAGVAGTLGALSALDQEDADMGAAMRAAQASGAATIRPGGAGLDWATLLWITAGALALALKKRKGK